MSRREPVPASYRITTKARPRSPLDGDIKRQASVTVIRYDKPTDDGKKVGTDIVRAWTVRAALDAALERGHKIVERDQRERARKIRDKIERLGYLTSE